MCSKPCKECPFRRDSVPGELGGNDHPEVFIGQAFAPFTIPCHMDPNYDPAADGKTILAMRRCEGAAAFRANAGIPDRLKPETLARTARLFGEANSEVFSEPAEFLAHHAEVPLFLARLMLEFTPPAALAARQLAHPGVKVERIPATVCNPEPGGVPAGECRG